MTGLTNDSEYAFEVLAVGADFGTKAGKRGDPATITATPMAGLAGPAAVEFPEVFDNASDWESLVGRYEKSGSYDWTLGGLDSSKFELTGTSGGFRQLHFLNPPDHESPTDAPEGDDTEGDNVYKVTVQARPSGPSGATSGSRFMLPVTVEVTDGDDPGQVTVAPTIARGAGPPRVGEEWTATVTDDDGSVTVSSWAWMHYTEFASAPLEPISGATSSTYRPVAEDIGQRISARASYTDGFDETNTKSEDSAPTGPVAGPPLAPGNLQAAPRDQAVLLTWDTPAANNGSALTGYEYRQSTDGGTTWDPDWTAMSLPAGTDAADLEEHTVTGLTNGTMYTFEVRAVNEVGEGAAAQVTMPPENLAAEWVLDGLHIFADHKAKLTWDDPGDSRITGWDYRQKAGNAAWEDWQEITGSSATTVTHSVEGLKIWRTYRFKVRARYGTHTGAEPEVELSPALPGLTQAPAVFHRGGDGKAQFEVGIDRPVDIDLPDGLLPNEYIQLEVTKTTAGGVTTVSDWTDLADIASLPGWNRR